MQQPRVLVVEDDFLICLTLAEALADDGFDVLQATDAAQALDHLAAADDIVLMMTDIQLAGGINGRELAKRVRATRPDLPIIFMTGQMPADATPSIRDVYITKPYLPSQICAAARRLMRVASQGA